MQLLNGWIPNRMDVEEFVLVPASLWEKSLDKTPQKIIIKPKIPEISRVTIQEKPQEYSQEPQINRIVKDLKGTWAEIDVSKEILDKILDHPRLDLSESDTIIIDQNNSGVYAAEFLNALQMVRGNLPKIYISILSLLKLSSSLVKNKDAKSENTGDWRPFNI